MDRLRREVDRLFAGSMRGRREVAPAYPAMNVWTGEDGATVTAELPGVKAEDIDISVRNDSLTLRGSRERETLGEGESYHRRERRFGSFSRTFQLPFQVESDKVDAKFENGVLSISLPRSEAEKARKIKVKGE
jgi:HSP20 family protein